EGRGRTGCTLGRSEKGVRAGAGEGEGARPQAASTPGPGEDRRTRRENDRHACGQPKPSKTIHLTNLPNGRDRIVICNVHSRGGVSPTWSERLTSGWAAVPR